MPELALSGETQNGTADQQSRFGLPKFVFPIGRRRHNLNAVTAGAQFRRETRDHRVETARVISVTDDSMGIPHVRYELEIRTTRLSDRLSRRAFARSPWKPSPRPTRPLFDGG